MIEINRRSFVVGAGVTAASLAGAAVVLGPGWSTPTRDRARRTSFGTVALLAWSRAELAPSGHSAAQHVHRHASAGADRPVPSAVHGAWTAAVTVDVEVRNRSRRAMELSPGQFRVRVDRGGPTVSLYGADRTPGPVDPGSATVMRISYLAPPPGRGLSLEFDDASAMRTVVLGRIGGAGVRS
jgi:pectin methylesterase-like acyl-CoA thioesterase